MTCFRVDGRIQKPGKRATRLFAETNGFEEFAENLKSSVENAQTKHSFRSVMMSSSGISQEKPLAKRGISVPASIPCYQTRHVGSSPPISIRGPGCRMSPLFVIRREKKAFVSL
jgi:hypothetical protein